MPDTDTLNLDDRNLPASGDSGSGPLLTYVQLQAWQPGRETLVSGRFLLTRFLGRGGFGLVFAARDLQEKREVALKFLNPEQVSDQRRAGRIKREFELAAKFQHPGLVKLKDLLNWQGLHCLVMELIQGLNLRQLVELQGARSWPETEKLIRQLIEVLGLLHQQGVVHRDIKPSNLMLDRQDRLVLLDLGLTRELDDPRKTASTGELVGSPHYLPPEVILGRPSAPASDLYQLALVAYFLLSARHPFDDEDSHPSQVIGRQLASPLRLPAKPILPAKWRRLLAACLEKNPAARPRDAAHLADLLGPGKMPARLLLRLRARRPILRLALASGMLMLLAGAGLYTFLPADRVMEHQGQLLARNALGRVVWRRGAPAGQHLSAWTAGPDTRGSLQVAAVFSPQAEPFSYEFSLDTIRPEDFPFMHRGWDQRGRLRFEKEMLGESMNYFDFYPISQVVKIEHLDLDLDGRPEIILNTQQAGGMFPALLSAWGTERKTWQWLFSPGYFRDASLTLVPPAAAEPGPASLAVLAMSNPFCHYTLWAWNIKLDRQTVIPPTWSDHHVPHLKTRDMIILPEYASIKRNDWREKGLIVFENLARDTLVTVEAGGRVSIQGPAPRVFQEDFQANSRIFTLLNRAFYHLSRQQAGPAGRALAEIDQSAINNPWLNSLVSYFRAETAAQQADLAQARAHLRAALASDPGNSDAFNRLCELEVLEQGPLAGLEYLQDYPEHRYQFWGLVKGQELFNLTCHLMAGDLPRAGEYKQRLARNYSFQEHRLTAVQALAALYQDSREGLESVIERLLARQRNNTVILDISEQQLILARLWTVTGRLEKAEPFLRHFSTHTLRHRPFAEVSLAWYEIEQGQSTAGLARAERAFSSLRRMAGWDFWARFWLFYDAWAYGRAMEAAGEPSKAAEGYRLCLELAPHSFLAVESRERLALLPD